MKIFFLVVLLALMNGQCAFAGRPVFRDLTRDQLIAQSGFIFIGWPSPQPANATKEKCPSEMARWQVHKVLKGDQTLKDKIISIADHKYEVYLTLKDTSKGPSFAAGTYKTGMLNREQTSSVIFTNKKNDGCFELVAYGAQEHESKEAEIEALTANPPNCELAKRGFDMRLDTLTKSCVKSDECKVFDVHPDPQKEPPVLNKQAESEMNDEFKSLQNNLKLACTKVWSQQTAEVDWNLPVRCKKNICQKGMDPGVPVKFITGTISNACAPHDAASKWIELNTTKTGSFPKLTINWWTPMTVPVKTTDAESYKRGLQVSYCQTKQVCTRVLKINLRVLGDVLEFDLETEDAEKLKGSVKLRNVEGRGGVCGG